MCNIYLNTIYVCGYNFIYKYIFFHRHIHIYIYMQRKAYLYFLKVHEFVIPPFQLLDFSVIYKYVFRRCVKVFADMKPSRLVLQRISFMGTEWLAIPYC